MRPIILGFAAVAVISTLVGCASTSAPTHTHRSAVVPAATPKTVISTPAITTMPPGLDAADQATLIEFSNMPLAEQLQYCSWQTRDMSQVAQNWEQNTKDPDDVLPTLKGQDKPQALLTWAAYSIRAAWISHEGGNTMLSDLTSQKVLRCALSNDGTDWPPTEELFNVLNYANASGQTQFADGYYAQHEVLDIANSSFMNFEVGHVTSVTSEGLVNGNWVVSVNLSYANGDTDKADLTEVKATNYAGKPMYFVTAKFYQS